MRKIFSVTVCIFLFLFSVQTVCHAYNEKVKVIALKGDVKIVRAGSSFGYQCVPNMPLKDGDWISTGNGSYVKIAFDDMILNVMNVKENSIITVRNDGDIKLELIEGEITTLVKGLTNGETFSVMTPAGLCGARGTGWAVSAAGDMAKISVFEHKVFMRGINRDGTLMDAVWINEGFASTTKKFEKPGIQSKISDIELEKMEDLVATFLEEPETVRLDATPVVNSIGRDRSGIVELNGVGINIDMVDTVAADTSMTPSRKK